MRLTHRLVPPSSVLVLAVAGACAPTPYQAPEPMPEPQPGAAPAPTPAPTPAPMPPPAPAPAPAPAPPPPMPMQHAAHTVELMPVNASGVSGTATIRGSGMSSTEVAVDLRGAEGAGEHEGHVHTGTCSAIGSPVFPLEPVVADTTGEGRSVSRIDARPMTLMDGNHLIAFHAAGGEPGPAVVCGNIPAMEHE